MFFPFLMSAILGSSVAFGLVSRNKAYRRLDLGLPLAVGVFYCAYDNGILYHCPNLRDAVLLRSTKERD